MRTAHKIFSSLLLGSLVASAPSAMAITPVKAPSPLAPVPAAFVTSNDAFASDLYAQLSKKPGNVFYSPASISTALAMTYAGARGDTAKQMAKTMHFDLASNELHEAFGALLQRLDSSAASGKNPELRVANRLFGQTGMPIEKAFATVTHDRYAADVELLDFKKAADASRKTINTWVDGKTNSKIKDLMPEGSVNADTRLVLVNAIYFKGTWASQFTKTETKDEPFALSSTSTKKVPTMHQTLHAKYAETSDAQVLSLPYKSADADHALSMVIVLPKTSDGLSKLEGGFTAKQLETYGSGGHHQEVIVSMPKFKTTYSTDLGDTLKKMGMPLAFDEGKADFSGITKSESLFISKVVHKAFVDVNEEGTEAAAATGVGIGMATSVPPKPITFKADHPFAFMIRDDKTGTILFMGRIADPSP